MVLQARLTRSTQGPLLPDCLPYVKTLANKGFSMATLPCGLNGFDGAQWCGPTAIAAITGIAPEEVERAILSYRATHKPPKASRNMRGQLVRTLWWHEVEPVLRLLGWRAVETEPHYRLRTFASWLRGRTGDQKPYLVLVTGHFVAVQAGWFVDTRFRQPIELKRLLKKPYARSRVRRAVTLSPI
jgi:hypothetical protein